MPAKPLPNPPWLLSRAWQMSGAAARRNSFRQKTNNFQSIKKGIAGMTLRMVNPAIPFYFGRSKKQRPGRQLLAFPVSLEEDCSNAFSLFPAKPE